MGVSHVAAILLKSLLKLQHPEMLLSLGHGLVRRCREVHNRRDKYRQALDGFLGIGLNLLLRGRAGTRDGAAGAEECRRGGRGGV